MNPSLQSGVDFSPRLGGEKTTAEAQRLRRKLPTQLLKALHAEWRKLSPSISFEGDILNSVKDLEREARLAWTNEQFKSRRLKVGSWNDLKSSEARFLLKKMREESGDNAAWRAMKLAELAAELFGTDWNAILRERLVERFRTPNPQSLSPHQFWSEAEELLNRIARRDGIEIEEVRKKFFYRRDAENSRRSRTLSGEELS